MKKYKEHIIMLAIIITAIGMSLCMWHAPKEYFTEGTPEHRGATESLMLGR